MKNAKIKFLLNDKPKEATVLDAILDNGNTRYLVQLDSGALQIVSPSDLMSLEGTKSVNKEAPESKK